MSGTEGQDNEAKRELTTHCQQDKWEKESNICRCLKIKGQERMKPLSHGTYFPLLSEDLGLFLE